MKQRWWRTAAAFAAGAAFGVGMTLVVPRFRQQSQIPSESETLSLIWPPTPARSASSSVSSTAPSRKADPESDLMYFQVIEPPDYSKSTDEKSPRFGTRVYSRYGPYILGGGSSSQSVKDVKP